MSIFINKEMKDNAKNYWFGLLTPIVIGWGCSLFSFSVLIIRDVRVGEYGYIDYFFGIFMVLGHLIIWPLLAYLLIIQHANKFENLFYKKGVGMSIKLYIIWVVFFVVPGIILAILEGG